MRMNWMMLMVFATLGLAPALGEPRSDNDPQEARLLSAAVAKVNKIIGKQYQLEPTLVTESKAFEPLMKVSLTGPQIERRPDGSVLLTGEILVSVLPIEKYWTSEERTEVGRLQRELIKAKSDATRAVNKFQQEWVRRFKRGGRIMSGEQKRGWFNIHTGAHITDAAYEQRIVDIRAGHARHIADLQEAVDALRRPIEERIQREKAADDTVRIVATVSADRAAEVDWPAVSSSSKTLMYARVISYDTLQMPAKAGVGLRVSRVNVDATGFSKSRITAKKAADANPVTPASSSKLPRGLSVQSR